MAQSLSTKLAGRHTESYDATDTDPGLLAQNSQIITITTPHHGYTYDGIRVFHKPHTQADKLPNDLPLPLIVCIHGLGGSVAQFHPLLLSLTNTASCLAIDLPGCGRSEMCPPTWDAYTSSALLELLDIVINRYRDRDRDQRVVLIGHSMGATLCAALAGNGRPPLRNKLYGKVVGLVAICPPPGPPPPEQVKTFRWLLRIPEWLFNIWRWYERRGGPESVSVTRFVGADADAESKRLQYLFNRQSRTPTFRRIASGLLPTTYDQDNNPINGMPGSVAWSQVECPVLLIGGDKDNVTPHIDIAAIMSAIQNGADKRDGAPTTTTPATTQVEDAASEGSTSDIPAQPDFPTQVVESDIIAGGTHALLYTPVQARILACKISEFLAAHVTGRLSLAWQLQYLAGEGKWDVKNLAKWQSVAPVSEPIPRATKTYRGKPVFRAMKTMREVDEEHSPVRFVEKWKDVITDVVDISHDTPVYDPAGLERAGVKYHKFPTVSKIPPTDVEVEAFMELIDRLREEKRKSKKDKTAADGAASNGASGDEDTDGVIGVHCHYGFNRTGYFLVCYMVERCGMTLEEAIQDFATQRPKGIKHSHFLDKLYVRYGGNQP